MRPASFVPVLESLRRITGPCAVKIAENTLRGTPGFTGSCATLPICFRIVLHWYDLAVTRLLYVSGRQQCDQHGNDGNDHQQFDQGVNAFCRGPVY